MPFKRMMVVRGTDTVYTWDTIKKVWLLTPDVTIPVLTTSVPNEDGYSATNIYIEGETKQVVIDYDNKR